MNIQNNYRNVALHGKDLLLPDYLILQSLVIIVTIDGASIELTERALASPACCTSACLKALHNTHKVSKLKCSGSSILPGYFFAPRCVQKPSTSKNE